MADTYLKGKDALIGQLKALGVDVEKGAVDSLKVYGGKIKSAIRAELSNSAGVSAPGSPPAKQTGELQKAVWYALAKPEISKPVKMFVRVAFSGLNAYYGHMLEYGTSKMAARPFFWPTITRMIPGAQAAMSAAIEKVVKRYAAQKARAAAGIKRSHH